jgi:hypothetical protein
MSLSATTLQPAAVTETPVLQNNSHDSMSSLLSAIMLTVYAGQKSRKQLRKLKRKAAWLAIKEKIASSFSRDKPTERQIIIYILIGVLILALIIAEPIAALALAVIGLVLFLTGVI